MAGGAHSDFPSAQAAMTSLKNEAYQPIPANQKIYGELYPLYRDLHDAFGGVNRSLDLSQTMKRLIQIKTAQS